MNQNAVAFITTVIALFAFTTGYLLGKFKETKMDKATFKYGLGDRAKDRISGLEGIIVSRAQHLFGCSRYWVQPREIKDGKPVDGAWLDEDSIEVLENQVIEAKTYKADEETGGPFDAPPSHKRGASR